MNQWKIIEAKFSEKELTAIRYFMKKNNVETESKLVRLAIEKFIGLTSLDWQSVEDFFPVQNALIKFYIASLKKLESYSNSSSKSLKDYNEFAEKWILRWHKKNYKDPRKTELLEFYEDFRKHKPRGRPKAKKKKRGKPKDLGYDN